MLKRIYKMIMAEELELKDRFFRILLILGSAVFGMAVLEEFLMHGVSWVLWVLIPAVFVMLIGIYLTFWAEKSEMAVVLIGVILIFFVFPTIFLGYGGISSDSDIWLVLGMAYIALMFRGKRLIFFSVLTILIDILLFVFCHYWPEQAEQLIAHENNAFDALFSMLCVGITIAALLKFQISVYEKEWHIVKRQTKELEKLGQSKDAFFANMSHEIRTPINTIIGLNEMTLRSEVSDDIIENAIDIQNASKLLLELVNDILDMSKIETGKMEIVPAEYDTRKMLDRLIKLIKVNIRKKDLQLHVDIDERLPRTLFGDEKRISQILLNLLTNAAKYTPSGSVTLEVHAEWMEEDRVRLKLIVQDTGIGIKKEDMSALFASFQRVDAQNTHKIEGTGLGLSITKQLVDMMGGEITVDSIYTKGSTFTVTLEQLVTDPAPIENPTLLSQGTGMERQKYQQLFEAPEAKVLLVDDNDMNLKVVQKLLQATKVQIVTARSGKECLEATKKAYYHVILLDYMMPVMSGLETLKALRKQESGLCREAPVIALTGNILPGGETAYIAQGFDAYLEKPVNGALLEERILEFLPEDIVEYHNEEEPEPVVEVQKSKAMPKRKRRKICITSDCVCDIPEEWRDAYNIKLMYLYIRTDSGRFRDTAEVDSVNLARQMRRGSSKMVADSASVEEYENFFAGVLMEAESIIHISMGEHMGKSYSNAVKAAQSFGHVHVINSGFISGAQGLLVLQAGQMAKEGYGVQEIYRQIGKARGRISASFLMPSVEVFHEKGYANGLMVKICEAFSMHPRIVIKQERLLINMAWFGKMENAVRSYISRQFFWKWKIDRKIVYITHAGCGVKLLETVIEEVKNQIPFENIIVEQASVSSTCNSGLGTIGIAFFWK